MLVAVVLVSAQLPFCTFKVLAEGQSLVMRALPGIGARIADPSVAMLEGGVELSRDMCTFSLFITPLDLQRIVMCFP